MVLLQIILISIGLSLDVFAYGLYKGAMVSEIQKGSVAKMTGIFAVLQVGMLLWGNALTRIPVIHVNIRSANQFWDIVAVLLFFGVGVRMIIKSFRKQYKYIKEEKQDDYDYRLIVFWAFMTSIDAFIAGIGFGFLSIELMVAALVLGIMTIAATLVGIGCGYRLGCGPMNRFMTVGGCVVIIGGIDVLFHFLGTMR